MPAIVVFGSEPEPRADLVSALALRFGGSYAVVAATEGDIAGFDSIAVALAPIGTSAFGLLGAVGVAHPGARRVAVVTVGDNSVADELMRAMTLGQIDFYVGHPFASAEEELYPVISEALRLWSDDRKMRFVKATIVTPDDQVATDPIGLMLNRNGVPAVVHGAGSAAGRALLEGPLEGLSLPAVQLWDGRVLSAPSLTGMAEALGAHTRPAEPAYDVVIVGAGPAGLAAATYAASEGLTAVVVESTGVGGQAATSAKIRNYLGFPWGVRGADLAALAGRQSQQLGAEVVVQRAAAGLRSDGGAPIVTLSNGDEIRAGAVVIAGGVMYRMTGVATVDALVGHGVFYGASAGEASSMAGLNVAVLGGGNSAGQAAAHLAAAGAEVTVLIRGDSLAKSMSGYLVQQLEGTPRVSVRTNTQVRDTLGDGQLSTLVLADSTNGTETTVATDALFVFIGARPHTEWLAGSIDLDEHGFVVTGADGAAWLETSMPAVYAAGDIRAGSIKRVAAAVGEGSTAAMLARELLQGSTG